MERLHKALGQLRKLQFIPVDRSTKARITSTKIYRGVMYGIEANDVTEQQLATLASAVIDDIMICAAKFRYGVLLLSCCQYPTSQAL